MTDFTIEDQVTTMRVTPNTNTARDWMDDYMHGRGHARDDRAYTLPPGFLAHAVLPAMKSEGFTVDGAVDVDGRVRLEVQY